MKANNNSKILLVDIEWRPAKAFVWQPWGENIHPEKIIEDGGLLCVGMKWFGERETIVVSEWEHSHEGMLAIVHEHMSEADAIIGYNSDRYDIPKLNGEFVLHGFDPIPPLTSIDLIKTVKKFGFFMNRLAFIGPFLGIGKKVAHEGFSLWTKVMAGDTKAQDRMIRYCRQDVVLTEKLYRRIRPFIKNHPHLGDVKGECGACGSNHVQSRGYRRTKSYRIQRLQCVKCGSWGDGKRTKVV